MYICWLERLDQMILKVLSNLVFYDIMMKNLPLLFLTFFSFTAACWNFRNLENNV